MAVFNVTDTTYLSPDPQLKGLRLQIPLSEEESASFEGEFVESGALGKVYRTSTPNGSVVAIKLSKSTDNMKSMQNEYQLHIRLSSSCPGVPKVYGFGSVELGNVSNGHTNHHYKYGILMEYIDGDSLDTIVLNHGALDAIKTCLIGQKVAGILRELHREHLTHRDLSPKNIMVVPSPDGNDTSCVYILDFGSTARTDDSSFSLGLADSCFGSPEVFAVGVDDDAVREDPRTDIWSLGSILYYLRTGKRWLISDELTESGEPGLKSMPKHIAREGQPRLNIYRSWSETKRSRADGFKLPESCLTTEADRLLEKLIYICFAPHINNRPCANEVFLVLQRICAGDYDGARSELDILAKRRSSPYEETSLTTERAVGLNDARQAQNDVQPPHHIDTEERKAEESNSNPYGDTVPNNQVVYGAEQYQDEEAHLISSFEAIEGVRQPSFIVEVTEIGTSTELVKKALGDITEYSSPLIISGFQNALEAALYARKINDMGGKARVNTSQS